MSSSYLTEVSVLLLVRNSYHDLRELETFLASAAQVVLADDGSTDETVSYARDQDYVVCDVSAALTFAEKRNTGIRACSQPWILMLDTDERPLQGFEEHLGELIDSASEDVAGYQLRSRTHFGQVWLRHGGVYPLWTTRLFRRDCYDGFIGGVHERITLRGRILRSDLEVNHYSYRDTAHYLSKINLYTTLEAEELTRQGRVYFVPPVISLCTSIASSWKTARRRGARLDIDSVRDVLKESIKNRYVVLPAMPVYPIARFLSLYLVRRGYLDGAAGLKYAILSAIYSTVKYVKFFEMRRGMLATRSSTRRGKRPG